MGWRWLLRMLVFVYFTVLLALLSIRYLLLPNIDQFKPWIAHQLSQAIGAEIHMEDVQAGWQGFHISLQVADLQLFDDAGQPVLHVPHARGVVSWRSLLQGKPVFSFLAVQGLALHAHRDDGGFLWLLGHQFSRQSWIRQLPDPLPRGAQWLLSQQRIVVQDARLQWRNDAQQGAQSELAAIHIHLENTVGRHRLAAVATLPGQDHKPIEASGYLERRTPFGAPGSGAVQLTLPTLPVQEWRTWLELPPEVSFTSAAMNAWLAVEHGQVHQVSAHVGAQEVSVRLADQGVLTSQRAQVNVHLPLAHLRPPVKGFKAAAQQGVQTTLLGDKVSVSVPRVYNHALQFDRVKTDFTLLYEPQQWQLAVPTLSIHNQDAQVQAQGTWRQTPDDWGWLDMRAEIPQANAARVAHYLPNALPAAVRDWVDQGLQQGEINGASVKVQGPLQDFPFDTTASTGTFRVRAPFKDLTLDYHPDPMEGSAHGWPELRQLQGQFAMDNGDIQVQAKQGAFQLEENNVIQVHEVTASVPAVRRQTTVDVHGKTRGAAPAYWQFYRQSPLRTLLNHALDDVMVQGPWEIPLHLRIPLTAEGVPQMDGKIHVQDSQLQWRTELPPLEGLSGVLAFTDAGVNIEHASARWFGDAVDISGALGDQDPAAITLRGHARTKALQSWLKLPGLARLQGRLPYALTIANLGPAATQGGPTFTLQSSLEGTELRFPGPLAKSARQAMPLAVRWGPGEHAHEQRLGITLGEHLQARLYHDAARDHTTPFFQRGHIEAGMAVTPVGDGLMVGISQPVFDAGVWDAIIDEFTPSQATPSRAWLPPLVGLQLQADQARLLGADLTQVQLALQRDGPLDWQAKLNANEATGHLQWMEIEGEINGPVHADFKRLALGNKPGEAPAQSATDASSLPDDINVPELVLNVEELILAGRHLGRLQLQGVNEQAGRVWRLTELALSSPAADLTGSGRWFLTGEHRGLLLDATADVRDLGAYLDQIGFADVMTGGAGTVEADIQWLDLPWNFDANQIVGNVQFEFQEGRLSTVHSETARLLELISMQSVSRLARLDINPLELTKSGFPFNVIRGGLALDQGQLVTEDYHVAGPAGTMVVEGSVALASATLDLDAVVVPNLDVSGAAIAAGVVVNPVVGLGAFITQWLLKDPLADAMAVRYKIGGTLQAPEIQAKERSKAPPVDAPEPITP